LGISATVAFSAGRSIVATNTICDRIPVGVSVMRKRKQAVLVSISILAVLLGAAAYTAVQLVPLPLELLRFLAPETVDLLMCRLPR